MDENSANFTDSDSDSDSDLDLLTDFYNYIVELQDENAEYEMYNNKKWLAIYLNEIKEEIVNHFNTPLTKEQEEQLADAFTEVRIAWDTYVFNYPRVALEVRAKNVVSHLISALVILRSDRIPAFRRLEF